MTPLFFAGCASWSRIRAEVVDPIHALLHHAYPEALEAGDRTRLEALFSRAKATAATAPSLALLTMFGRIENARVDIDTVNLEADPVLASVRLSVEGVDRDARPLSLLQNKQLILVREDAEWRLAADESTPMQLTPVPPTHFVDEAQIRGLWFQHATRRVPDPNGVPQRFIYGSGVAVADVNGDDWTDVFLLSGDRIELFLNDRGYFTNASAAWGLGQALDRVLTVALPLDFDNDGRLDLYGANGFISGPIEDDV